MSSNPSSSPTVTHEVSIEVDTQSEIKCVMALDQGTQSTRAILYDVTNWQAISSHQLSHAQIMPQAGWVEHDAEEIFERATSCIEAALSAAKSTCAKPVSVQALGITNQRETTVVWDKKTGKPLHNAVVWLDLRTAELCKELEANLGSKDYFRATCGLPISTYFSAMKLRWLLDNVPAVRAAAEEGNAMFGTIDTWLLYKFTGGSQGARPLVVQISSILLGGLESSRRPEHHPCEWAEIVRSKADHSHVSCGWSRGAIAAQVSLGKFTLASDQAECT
ncbi:hypothetical protein CYMTET_31036 [Cymbomonas tetramitiformis]|uniref:glycerol kinase n=1 Tax=Cymbomonas tetramitiformis TaxID=36881 RepID=A0AAE0FHL6_9CHLO|nr:hypothetical protein CYMTET_31036 [Cymbomonas tetramitiformis]